MAVITVQAQDARRKLKFSWPAHLLERREEQLVLYGDWERPLHRHDAPNIEGEIVLSVTNRSIEFYDLMKPYGIAALLNRTWQLEECYARVTLPPKYDEAARTLTFVMLGFDVQVQPTGSDLDYEILEHTLPGDPKEQDLAREALLELVELVERREGPFDPQCLDEYVQKARALSESPPPQM